MADSKTQDKPNLDWRLLELILVAIGAVPGALIRWQAAGIYFGDGDNVVVNVAGAFILGLLLSLIHISEPTDRQKSRMPSSA